MNSSARHFEETLEQAVRRAVFDAETRHRIALAFEQMAAALGDFRETAESLRRARQHYGPAPLVAGHRPSIGRGWAFTAAEIRRAGLTLGEAHAAGLIR